MNRLKTILAAAAASTALAAPEAEAQGFSLNLDLGGANITIDSDGSVGGSISGDFGSINGGTGAASGMTPRECRENALERLHNRNRIRELRGQPQHASSEPQYRQEMRACARRFD